MAHQRHDLGRQKLALARDIAERQRPRKKKPRAKTRPLSRYANWCRTRNHAPSCSCAY